MHTCRGIVALQTLDMLVVRGDIVIECQDHASSSHCDLLCLCKLPKAQSNITLVVNAGASQPRQWHILSLSTALLIA